MPVNNRRQRDLESRRKAKLELRVQNEIRRLEQVVQRREAKTRKAKDKLAEVKRKAGNA